MRSATSVYRVFAAYYRPVPRNSASARDLSALRPYPPYARGRYGYNIYLLPFNHLSRRILGSAASASRPKADS